MGIIGSVYYIPWFIGFDGLVVYTVNGGESFTTVCNTPDDGRKLRPKHVEL